MKRLTDRIVRDQIKEAQHGHQLASRERYKEWMEGAIVKGMRPLYKAITSHEQVLVNFFKHLATSWRKLRCARVAPLSFKQLPSCRRIFSS